MLSALDIDRINLAFLHVESRGHWDRDASPLTLNTSIGLVLIYPSGDIRVGRVLVGVTDGYAYDALPSC